jgi:hypothetical protein
LRKIQQQFKKAVDRHKLTKHVMRRLRSSNDQSLSVHRCTSYLKEEVILGPTLADSAILLSSSPSIHEVCFVCGRRVTAQEEGEDISSGKDTVGEPDQDSDRERLIGGLGEEGENLDELISFPVDAAELGVRDGLYSDSFTVDASELARPEGTAADSVPPATPQKITRPAPARTHARPPRKEKSGVAALDRYASFTEDDYDDDDDWDFIGGLVEDKSGARGTSLFARGVVDRYRLAVFKKPSTTLPPPLPPPPPLAMRVKRLRGRIGVGTFKSRRGTTGAGLGSKKDS